MNYLYGPKHGRLLKKPLDPAKCGTEAQHKAHIRRGEECDPCRLASNAAHAARRAKKLCTHSDGCTKRQMRKWLCCDHFRVVYGMSIAEYTNRRCTHKSGCDRFRQRKYLCNTHFREVYGMTIGAYERKLARSGVLRSVPPLPTTPRSWDNPNTDMPDRRRPSPHLQAVGSAAGL